MTKEQQDKINEFVNKTKDFLKDNNLVLDIKIDFPIYRELPVEGALAVKVLEKLGAKFVASYKETVKEGQVTDIIKK
jgi:hypothetical protein